MKIKDLFLREDGALSWGRVSAIFATILWAAITIYLVAKSQTWGHYEAFTGMVFGLDGLQTYNKKTEVTAKMKEPYKKAEEAI